MRETFPFRSGKGIILYSREVHFFCNMTSISKIVILFVQVQRNFDSVLAFDHVDSDLILIMLGDFLSKNCSNYFLQFYCSNQVLEEEIRLPGYFGNTNIFHL